MSNLTLLPADTYTVINKTVITDSDLKLVSMLYQPIIGYTAVSLYNTLVNATSVRQASDKVLHDFENPEHQGTDVEIVRAGFGQNLYDAYHGSQPEPPTPPTPSRKLPIIFYLRYPFWKGESYGY